MRMTRIKSSVKLQWGNKECMWNGDGETWKIFILKIEELGR
jgi:hypothetical protein